MQLNTLEIIGGLFCILGYYLTSRHIQKFKDDQTISFSSFLLWAIIDFITAIALALAGGKTTLPIIFVLGSTTIAFLLFIEGKRKWQPFDWIVSFSIFICLVIWGISRNNIITALSATIAVMIASLPQIRNSFLYPDKNTTIIWIAFLAANFVFLIEPHSNWADWEEFTKDRICPAANGLMNLLVLLGNLFSKRKTLRE